MKVALITTEKITKKFAGIKLSVFDCTTADVDNINLRDFDGVIVDMESFAKIEDKSSVDTLEFERKVFSPKIVSDVLGEEGSFFTVLGRPVEFLESKIFSTKLGFTLREIKGTGDSIIFTKSGEKTVYAKYLRKIKNYTYSFENRPQLDDYYASTFMSNRPGSQIIASITPLLLTRAKYYVAFTATPTTFHKDHRGIISDSMDVFKGPLAFLPVLPTGSKASIEAILEIYSPDIPSEAPDWAEEISVAGQAKVDEAIQGIKKAIATEQTKLDEALERRSSIRKPIEILYLSDKPLENALKSSFKLAGFDISDPKDSNAVEFYLQHGSHEFVTEVKSTQKATFNKEGMRQVNEWRENELLDTGKEYKPLLLLSNEYSVEPDKRNINFIDENLINFARSRGIAVVSVVTLYYAFQMIGAGKIKSGSLSKLLYDGDGIITEAMVNSLKKKEDAPDNEAENEQPKDV